MAAHRYWRVALTNNMSGLAAQVAELVLRTTAGGAQAATGGTPTCQECPNHRCACTPMHANEQGMSRGTEPAGKEHAIEQLRATRGSPGCLVIPD